MYARFITWLYLRLYNPPKTLYNAGYDYAAGCLLRDPSEASRLYAQSNCGPYHNSFDEGIEDALYDARKRHLIDNTLDHL